MIRGTGTTYALGLRALLAAWLLCTSPLHADEARRFLCRGWFFRMLNPGGRTFVHLPMEPEAVKEVLPDILSRNYTRSWLTHFLLDHFYQGMLKNAAFVQSETVKELSDLRRVFKPGQWHNIVVDKTGLRAIATSEFDGDTFFPNGVTAKHLSLVTPGEKPHFAGLVFFDGQDTIYVTNESGTFKPAGSTLEGVAELLRKELPPGLKVATFQRTPAEEFDRQVMARFENHAYRQEGSDLIDPLGDAVLLGEMGKKRKYANPANKDEWAEVYRAERQGRAGINPPWKDGYQIGERRPMLPNRLVHAFHQVILDNPQYPPYLGPTPKWSPQAFEFLAKKLWPSFVVPSKLFMAMMLGRSADFCPTGLEKELEARLLTYPDRALQMHEVFKEAYVLAKGDVTRALLTAENVLSKDSASPERDHTPIAKKLAYIRNDSKPRGDNYGNWYHTFGMMVFQMEHPHWMGQFVAGVEAYGSSLYTLHDRQEQHSNFIGVSAGFQLRKLVESGRASKPLPTNARTDYMNLIEFPEAKP